MDPYEITKKYYEQNAQEHITTHANPYNWTNQFSKFMKNLKGKKILDAGCGGGRDIEVFLKKGYEIEGLDYSPQMIEICKEKFPKQKFHVADMRNTGLPSEHYDGIWACASILNLEKKDVVKTLEEHKRILKKDGQIFISVKEGTGEKIVGDGGDERLFSFFSEPEIKELTEKAGFRVDETEIKTHKDLTGNPKTNEPRWICVYATKT